MDERLGEKSIAMALGRGRKIRPEQPLHEMGKTILLIHWVSNS